MGLTIGPVHGNYRVGSAITYPTMAHYQYKMKKKKKRRRKKHTKKEVKTAKNAPNPKITEYPTP